VTRNEDGKFKHVWDEKTMGTKPKKERKKRDAEAADGVSTTTTLASTVDPESKPKRIRKTASETPEIDTASLIANAVAGAVVKVLIQNKK
jgi:hypothetical protein